MIEFVDAFGAAIIRSLAAIRAEVIIAAGSFLAFAIAAANEAERLAGVLQVLFKILAVIFGGFSALVAAIFVIGQIRMMIYPKRGG